MDNEGRSFTVGFSRRGRHVTVAVSGEVDRQSSGVLRTLLLDVVDGQGNLSVALDVSGMTSIDSAGLALLLEMHGRAVQRGGSFVLHNVPPAGARSMEAAGLRCIVASA